MIKKQWIIALLGMVSISWGNGGDEVSDKKIIADYKAGKTAFFPKSQPAVTGNCEEDFSGIFGFSPESPSFRSFEVAIELGVLSRHADMKKPFYHLGKIKGQWYKKGLNSGTVVPIEIEYFERSYDQDVFSQMAGDFSQKPRKNSQNKVICRANFGGDFYIYRINGNLLSLEEVEFFRSYYERFDWFPLPSQEDLRRMQYLVTYSYSEIGIGGMTFFIPLVRVDKEPLKTK